MKYIYPAVFIEEKSETSDVVYVNVKFPDIYGCVTFGESLEEAVKMAKEALSCAVENGFLDHSKPTPKEKIQSLFPDNIVLDIEVDC